MSTTRCPCPHPPGGSVTCEGSQFAYCHVIDGEVRSGCIPSPRKSTRPPTTSAIVPLFKEVLASAGFDDRFARNVVYYADAGQPLPWRFQPDLGAFPEFLELAMQNGLAIGLILGDRGDYLRSQGTSMLLVRFPSIWARHDASPEGTTTTVG